MGSPPVQQQPPSGGMGEPQQQHIRSVSIDRIVQEDVVIANLNTSIQDVVSKMSQEDVGSVVIVDDDDHPLDVITDRKIALLLEDETDISDLEVSDITEENVITAASEISVSEALDELQDAGIRRLPIVENDTLAGIVTLDDLLVYLAHDFQKAANIIQSQAPRL